MKTQAASLLLPGLLFFRHVLTLEEPSAITLPSQTLQVTTLPPAEPSSNNSNPCNFTDRGDLLDRVVSDWQGYNVSLLVQTCPEICILIYGNGNPDVSGVGAMASYLIQFVSTILSGPVICTATVFEERLSDTVNQFLDKVKADLVPKINLGNSYIMLSLFIAAWVRITQTPPVFELDFITYLLFFQACMAFGRMMMTIYYVDINDTTNPTLTAMVFFLALASLLVPIISIMAYPTGFQKDALNIISKFCIAEDDLPITIFDQVKGQFPWLNSLPVTRSALPVIFIIGAAVTALIVWLLRKIWKANGEIILLWLSTIFKVEVTTDFVFSVVFWPVWMMICIELWILMQDARKNLERALGKLYLDNFWGFGQITIMVMWVPTLIQVVNTCYRFYHEKRQSQRPMAAEAQHHELQPLHSSTPAENTAEDGPEGTRRDQDSATGSDVDEDAFPLRQRATFPRDEQGNYLPR